MARGYLTPARRPDEVAVLASSSRPHRLAYRKKRIPGAASEEQAIAPITAHHGMAEISVTFLA